MREFLKRLFCKHDYEWYNGLNSITYDFKAISINYFECKKCGKVITRKHNL